MWDKNEHQSENGLTQIKDNFQKINTPKAHKDLWNYLERRNGERKKKINIL